MPLITEELLAKGRSPAGGWTRAQLIAIGVDWPPIRGWKAKILGTEISEESLQAFLATPPTSKQDIADGANSVDRQANNEQPPSQPTAAQLNALRSVVNPLYRPLRWPTRAEEAAYLRARREQNLQRSLTNQNENWMANRLLVLQCSGHWRRQYLWGYRIFDFFESSKGIAIEVDGDEHDRSYDSYRDVHNFLRSGIIVLRVRNQCDPDARAAVDAATRMCTWRTRRAALGATLVHRKHLVVQWRAGRLNGEQLLANTIAKGLVPSDLGLYFVNPT